MLQICMVVDHIERQNVDLISKVVAIANTERMSRPAIRVLLTEKICFDIGAAVDIV